jgi:PAS domain S-box-containing protein
MTTNETENIGLLSLPNLRKYFISSTIFILVTIFLGQSIQDHYQKEEILETRRIHAFHLQLGLASQIMNQMLQLQTFNNQVEYDAASKDFLISINMMKSTSDDLENLTQQLISLGEADNIATDDQLISAYISGLVLQTNEILAMMEAELVDKSVISEIYHAGQSKHLSFRDESIRLIERLSTNLEREAAEHRQVIWNVVIVIMVLVVIASLLLFKLISSLVKREFETVGIINKQLAEDNLFRQQNEQAMAEQTELMLVQQMKTRSILDSTIDAIITITADGEIDSFNKAAETMFGYPADFVIGKNVKILMPEPYSSEHDGYIRNYHQTGEQKMIGIPRVVEAKRIDGSTFPIEVTISEVPLSGTKLFTGIIRDITAWKVADEKLRSTMAELTEKQELFKQEEIIARHVFENITASNNDAIPEVASWCQPMGAFSGDLMLSAILPSGALRVLLCDFTGHGLPAALGAVPVSSIHSAMAQKGLSLEILMDELNNKLKALLPTGIFCCIAGVDIDVNRTHAHIWNAGLPDALLISKTGEIKQRFKSSHLPLGVTSYDQDEKHCQDIRFEMGDCIYMYSDGLTEAENNSGEMLGQQGFEKFLNCKKSEDGRLTKVKNMVGSFVGDTPVTDDISLIEIKTLVSVDEITLKS